MNFFRDTVLSALAQFKEWATAGRYEDARAPYDYDVESLETRMMLSGDVSVFTAGRDLLIYGDGASNQVEVTVLNGDVIVEGSAGTTINGRNEAFVARANNNHLRGAIVANMRGGDDVLVISRGVSVGRSIRANLGSGNDFLGIDTVRVNDNLFVHAGGGDDQVVVRSTFVDDNVHTFASSGNDVLHIENSQILKNVFAYGGSGDDVISFEGSINERSLFLFGDSGKDDILVRLLTVNKDVHVHGGSGDDFTLVDQTTINRRTFTHLGSGNDNAVVGSANDFQDKSRFYGSSGDDNIEINPSNNFLNGQRQYQFEGDEVSNEFIQQRLFDPINGAQTRINNANALLDQFLGLRELFLELDLSANNVIQSNDTLLVNNASFVIAGTSIPGAFISVDIDSDGQFDDGMATVDGNGNFSINVNLTNNSENLGVNNIRVRAIDRNENRLEESIDVHFAAGSVVRFDTVLGAFDIELFDNAAPMTVQNFLGYIQQFQRSIIHRSVENISGDPFIIQGGGFNLEDSVPVPIITGPPIENEFDPMNSNLRGTISMALPDGQPNGGTSQWFINLNDNFFLDEVPHPVFGRIIGTGITVADTIFSFPTFNIASVTNESALTDVPLLNYLEFTLPISGTVSVEAGTNLVAGENTNFTSELVEGQRVQIAGQIFNVDQIINDTTMILSGNHTIGARDVVATQNELPNVDQYVTINRLIDPFVDPI